jgi:hypothetical protein
MTREECIQSTTERRDYVRALLLSQLNAYLFKRSTKAEDGRQHIHYCNAASAQRLICRFSGSFRNETPEPSDSVQTPPASAPVTAPSTRLNPNAADFQPASNNDGETSDDATSSRLHISDSISTLISPIVRINEACQSGFMRLDHILHRSSSFDSVREALKRASQRSLTPSPLLSMNASSASDNTASPLIVAFSASPPPHLNAPSPIASPIQQSGPAVTFAPPPPFASTPPSPVNVIHSQPSPVLSQPVANVTQPQPSPVVLQPTSLQPTVTFAPPNPVAIPPIAPPTIASPNPTIATAPPPIQAPFVSLAQPVHVTASASLSPLNRPPARATTSRTTSVSNTQTRTQTQTVPPPTVNPPPTSAPFPLPLPTATNAPIIASPGDNDPNNDPDSSSSDFDDSSDSSESNDYRYDSQGRRKKRKKKKSLHC